VLFTRKYQEFCKIVTHGQSSFIDFLPPKRIWRKEKDLEILLKNFRVNHELLSYIAIQNKNDISSLFTFQSAYLKNCLHFNIEKSDQIQKRIQKAYEEELNQENGIFLVHDQYKSVKSLKNLMEKIEEMILNCIESDVLSVKKDFDFNETISEEVRSSSVKFQNLTLPHMFLTQFCTDHLTSESRAELYLGEYKKFLFLYSLNKKDKKINYCPFEEVDLIWHFHALHTKSYKDMSQTIMNKDLFQHNPSLGGKDESKKHQNSYDTTLSQLKEYFKSFHENAWPEAKVRFSQNFKWATHHHFIQKSTVWKNELIFKTKDRHGVSDALVGCYFGCGFLLGRPAALGCGPLYQSGCGPLGIGEVGCLEMIEGGNIGGIDGGCGSCSGGGGCSGSCGGGCGG